MRTIDQMIQSEVLVCVSHLVATLASVFETDNVNEAMNELHEQAQELACPVPDYEEAAIQAGWKHRPHLHTEGAAMTFESGAGVHAFDTWQELCEDFDIEPYDREVFEHWAVTDWFADKLIAAGEKVDKDFAGMCVWARTTTGQGIAQDYVIQSIHKAMMGA